MTAHDDSNIIVASNARYKCNDYAAIITHYDGVVGQIDYCLQCAIYMQQIITHCDGVSDK
jgi:hypothetical protein